MHLAHDGDEGLPAEVSADLFRLLTGGWAITGLQLASGETGLAYLVSASAGEWSLLSSYPRGAGIAAAWTASLYRGLDEYIVLDRQEFITIVGGTHNDLMRAWASKEHQLEVPEEHEDGPAGDEPAGADGLERLSFAGFMTIRGNSAVYAELLGRKQQFGRFVINAEALLGLDEGSFIEVS
ncbi:hypothetical protein [Nonomuraea sp. GTA35]|uniref:hypothetical protein n=1 Tax=Nonomuraea sp. GTA35 TaxID=1676746 RepID=UPI0035C08B98